MLYSAVLMRRLYLITRDLHLYLGMFISPFVLVFSLSVILLVHGCVPAAIPEPAVRTVTGLSLPVGLERLAGRDLVNALRPVLDAIGVKGEVDFIRAIPREHSLVIPVHLPGRDTVGNINLNARPAQRKYPRQQPLHASLEMVRRCHRVPDSVPDGERYLPVDCPAGRAAHRSGADCGRSVLFCGNRVCRLSVVKLPPGPGPARSQAFSSSGTASCITTLPVARPTPARLDVRTNRPGYNYGALWRLGSACSAAERLSSAFSGLGLELSSPPERLQRTAEVSKSANCGAALASPTTSQGPNVADSPNCPDRCKTPVG